MLLVCCDVKLFKLDSLTKSFIDAFSYHCVLIHVLVWQEAWCKRLPPDFYYNTYKPQPVLKEMSKGSLRQQDTALTKSKKALLDAADAIGRLIQYNSPGFMKNARQVPFVYRIVQLDL